MSITTSFDAPRLAQAFKALSDEKRLRILGLLRDGEHCVCDLTSALDAGQSLLSFHLKTLKDAGLVNDRREGRWVYYTLNEDALAELGAFMGRLELDDEARPAGGGATCCG